MTIIGGNIIQPNIIKNSSTLFGLCPMIGDINQPIIQNITQQR
ncbi:hypothetical protein [Campylobacter troglodytis]|nr:hypothetical protein [Campylobacter troglodytis]